VQVPGVTLQTSQLPAHAVLQQVPSAQNPDWHALADVQAVPLATLDLHVPWSHQLPPVHCASLLQGLAHPVPEQMYGAQSVPVVSTPHTPLPSHTCNLSRLPTQVLLPHEVPLE
jgi:hypothetical protein